MIKLKSRNIKRKFRHKRVRKRISGTPDFPRLSVFKSRKNIYAQVIDDINGVTICSASSLTPGVKELLKKEGKDSYTKTEVSKYVGIYLGELSSSKGITKVRFDRGGYPYQGRVKAMAEGLREKGMEF